MTNSVIDPSSSMLLDKVGLRNVKSTQDWGTNIINIQGNGMLCTILLIHTLSTHIKRLKNMLCYNFAHIEKKLRKIITICNYITFDIKNHLVALDKLHKTLVASVNEVNGQPIFNHPYTIVCHEHTLP
jgi:hypothetical protein